MLHSTSLIFKVLLKMMPSVSLSPMEYETAAAISNSIEDLIAWEEVFQSENGQVLRAGCGDVLKNIFRLPDTEAAKNCIESTVGIVIELRDRLANNRYVRLSSFDIELSLAVLSASLSFDFKENPPNHD